MVDSTRHTCLRLKITDNDEQNPQLIFIQGTWYNSHFDLSIADGLDAWICNASEDEVEGRASQWDQPVTEYIQTAERYLGFQQPGSTYSFVDAGDGHRRLSWTFEKQGFTLEWRWKCKPSPNIKKTTSGILDFLMDANIQLSEEVVRNDRLKVEAEKCLSQSENFKNVKSEFDSAIYSKYPLSSPTFQISLPSATLPPPYLHRATSTQRPPQVLPPLCGPASIVAAVARSPPLPEVRSFHIHLLCVGVLSGCAFTDLCGVLVN